MRIVPFTGSQTPCTIFGVHPRRHPDEVIKLNFLPDMGTALVLKVHLGAVILIVQSVLLAKSVTRVRNNNTMVLIRSNLSMYTDSIGLCVDKRNERDFACYTHEHFISRIKRIRSCQLRSNRCESSTWLVHVTWH